MKIATIKFKIIGGDIILKENNRHFDLCYNLKAIEEVSAVCEYGGNIVLKGSLSSDEKNGKRDFVKTFYEIKPVYCVLRTNRA